MAAKPAYQVGDIVQLKSGGPKMTVEDPSAFQNRVECQWFAGSKLESGLFPESSLMKPELDKKESANK